MNEILSEEVARAMLDGPTTEIVGPFRGDIYYLSVDGCKLFGVHLYKRTDTKEDWAICVDDRFEIDANNDEILRWGYLLANAMAVSAGFTYHGPDSKPLNSHRVQFSSYSGGNLE